ncbi:dienelactone hydrolase family protein [Solitalea sp. MAHUQ-68]|uniref:Dienelactone hydrolase family protein n=1 Tax=Solitalea agri TaxID=2953739 RepID=A0A9X2EZQ8_9SPHI|nr:alpha/beta fold hydrolase [Solitalea agri]MCO4291942.1 dienelactone hydrolase family protein [Solitalea agri]
MTTQALSLFVSETIGTVSAECNIPENAYCVLTLAHGAGANMQHEFMVALSESLAEKGIATIRFNFPFMEGKKGRPDTPATAYKAIDAAVLKARELFSGLPLFVSGKSFGGRMSSQYLALHHSENVKGIIFYGFPLHSPGKPSVERAEHLKEVKVPLLFLQGSRDEFATWELIKSVCDELSLATLVEIEGANHAFKAGKKNVIEVLVEAIQNWILKVM